jgi:hypothetical protein
MEMEQMMECLLAKMVAIQEKMEANHARTHTNLRETIAEMKAW